MSADRDLSALGAWESPTGWRHILERYAGPDACSTCRGYGHTGNPLCGAVYTCKDCGGTGRRAPERRTCPRCARSTRASWLFTAVVGAVVVIEGLWRLLHG